MEKFNVSRLIGSPPGYVGYEEGGQLTEKVRRNRIPSCCSTKSRRRIRTCGTCCYRIPIEEGKLTDNVGRVVNFRNTIVLMTSNVGSSIIKNELIQKKVGEQFGLREADLKIRSNSKAIAYPRQIAMYLVKQLTSASLPEIGRQFGGRRTTRPSCTPSTRSTLCGGATKT